ncbi:MULTISPECIES: DUF6480 family protein [Streptomyces]|uniref:Uncharacterized protein n=1 Tax=Streptomyces xanthii TaxID=2768069 RepID=A0A7H1B1R2_9ACTN|nr:DUF6480 family protein [Streptomyces xanthii]QNS02667.1 hypothetical protein IAG42_02885 [Streptomyces xanthii]
MNGTDPDPRRTPGLAAGGAVPPGETPPGEEGTSAAISYPQSELLRKGWGTMPLIAIAVVTLLVAIGLVAMVVSLLA